MSSHRATLEDESLKKALCRNALVKNIFKKCNWALSLRIYFLESCYFHLCNFFPPLKVFGSLVESFLPLKPNINHSLSIIQSWKSSPTLHKASTKNFLANRMPEVINVHLAIKFRWWFLEVTHWISKHKQLVAIVRGSPISEKHE